MRQITDINELRQIQMGILDHVHQYCEAHGLTYFLSSGSLIGAVRHGGYIPWDDDIDIYMPRKDYEQLMQIHNDQTGRYRLLNPQRESHYFYTFAKVIDQNTLMVEDDAVGYEIGVYMDIFPVDYVPDDLKERERLFKRRNLLYKIRNCKIRNRNPLRSRLAYIVYRHLPITVKQLEKMILKLIVLKEPTNTVCNMTEVGPGMACCFPAEDIASTVDIQFEDRTYKTMVGYIDYLKHTYGDFMKLPPVEQRVTHHFIAYWK